VNQTEKQRLLVIQNAMGIFMNKKVTAKFCSEVGLLSIKPDCISEDETRGCDYGGVLYSPGEEFCFNTNIVKCMGNQVLDTVKICKVDCKGSQCVGEEGEPEERSYDNDL